MGSSGVVSNLPGILAQIEALVYWRKGAVRQRALTREAAIFPNTGHGCILPINLQQSRQ
jgi:hypothetical protein